MFFDKSDPFSWITSEKHRDLAASDTRELEICYKYGAYLACQILSASVMECVLDYALTRMRIHFPEGATLEKLISIAKENSLLPQGDALLGQAMRDYRNDIHAKKRIDTQRKPTKESAGIVKQK